MTLPVAALALALVATQPPDPQPRPANPFQPRPGDDRGAPPARRLSTPGRFAIATAGNTTLLLDTATGDTWVFDPRQDEPGWRPVRRPDTSAPAPAPKANARPAAPAGVEALGSVAPTRTYRVSLPGTGVVTKVAVREGDEVKPGDVLAVVTEGGKVDDTRVTSPAAGTVLAVRVEEGMAVRSGRGASPFERAGAAFEVADLRDLEVAVLLPEADVARVSRGQRCSARPLAGGREYAGEVAAVAPVVDPQTGTVVVRVRVSVPADAPPLRAGASVRVTFPDK